MRQSTNHLLMVEPTVFYPNPQTLETNAYQSDGGNISYDAIFERAHREFCDYRDMLVQNGVMVTTVLGHEECPDMVFPNWASTYDDGRLILYPMHSVNRRAERRAQIVERLQAMYPRVEDWSRYEEEGLALESSASIVCDHVNKRAYSGLSMRTSPELVRKWAEFMGYDVVMFETISHAGVPVYHTDFMMYIGTEMAGICLACISDEEMRNKVVRRLSETHEVVDFSMEQLQTNCCNALEVIGGDEERMLTMSQSAQLALSESQRRIIDRHYQSLICPDLVTLEKYGGGSARCMLMELF